MEKHVLAHAQSGDMHAVSADLRVLITQSPDGHFVAQGLDIDYVATGSTEQEASDRFASGFVRTVHAIFRRHRTLDSLFAKSRAPAEAWATYFRAARNHVLRCLSVHDLTEALADLPTDSPLPLRVSFTIAAN